jgi:hypothetical protein
MPSKLQAALAMAMARQGIAPPKHWKQERFKDLEFLNDKGTTGCNPEETF